MILALTLAIILATVLGALVYGKRQARAEQTMAEWAVGGRRFGVLIFWFLNAGEIYTTFAVLGISGFAWAFGAPAYLALTSISLAATVGYWLMPKIWAAGKRGDLVTQADFFAHHYRAPWLGVVVGIAGIAALIVYVQIQIVALSLIVRLTLGPEVGVITSATIAAVTMLAFVYFAGLRSAAFAAAVKDILMLVVVIGLCSTVAAQVGASSILDVYRLAQDTYPNIGHLPGLQPDAGLSTTWLMTSALNVALGTWILPHMFQLCYSSGSLNTIRRNAIWQPLYSLSYFFIILLGFAALLAGTAPAGGDLNAVLIEFVADSYPAWAVGLFAGTACLLALVPGSVLLLTAGSIFSRNVAAPLLPAMGEKTSLLLSRGAMIVFAAIAVYLTVGGSESLVEIGLSAYAAIGMLAPGVFLAFIWPRAHAEGVLVGIVAGYLALLLPAAEAFWNDYFPEWDHGLLALGVAAIVTILACLIWQPRRANILAAG
ncbi:sodium:solute symporter family protein [Pacificimonas sp. ICDLI1SI03]